MDLSRMARSILSQAMSGEEAARTALGGWILSGPGKGSIGPDWCNQMRVVLNRPIWSYDLTERFFPRKRHPAIAAPREFSACCWCIKAEFPVIDRLLYLPATLLSAAGLESPIVIQLASAFRFSRPYSTILVARIYSFTGWRRQKGPPFAPQHPLRAPSREPRANASGIQFRCEESATRNETELNDW